MRLPPRLPHRRRREPHNTAPSIPRAQPVIDKGLQRYVDSDRVAGVVALVMQDGQVVYEKAFGWADKEAGRRMTTDAIFRIASQTKALTSAAIMQLVEEGALALNTRAGTFIPSFARTTVAVASERGTVTQVPARRPITVRDLLTHTAGISYGTDPSVAALYEAEGTWARRRVRLVHRRQERTRLRHDGAARHAAVRRAAR